MSKAPEGLNLTILRRTTRLKQGTNRRDKATDIGLRLRIAAREHPGLHGISRAACKNSRFLAAADIGRRRPEE
jgi:hypothetical protein